MIGWRAGSAATSEQTSVKREARKSLTSLWCTVGNPPVGQFRAWSVLKGLPQMHWEGSLSRAHPYLGASASLNAPLWMAKPWCRSGMTVSQLEAPFSLASFLTRCNVSGNLSWTLATAWSSFFHFVCIISRLAQRFWDCTWARSVCL